jgi:hypothetical protein
MGRWTFFTKSRRPAPRLLSNVPDALLSMTGENWQDHCEGLTALVRPGGALE